MGSSLAKWPVTALQSIIVFYRGEFRAVLPTACKYYPSCSHYAEQAIARHGALMGLTLALRRLARCHPFSAGGYDPVPERLKSHG